MFKSRLSAGVLFALGLVAAGAGLRGPTQALTLTTPSPGAQVSIEGTRFLLNGTLAAPGGLLMNSRMVMGIFDDENLATVGNWAYPDTHLWNPQRNTSEFVAAMPWYAQHGVRLLTVGLQGGCPLHTAAQPHCPSNMAQPWIVSAFNADGSLKSAWLTRLDQVIRAADANGIVIVVSLFDKLQNLRVTKQVDAVNNITDWLVGRGYTNVMVETANECDVGGPGAFTDYLWCGHEAQVIKQVQTRSGGRLKVSVSYGGGRVPDQDVIAQSDFVLLHGNSQNAAGVTTMINHLRATPAYRAAPKPVMINEDSTSVENLDAAVAAQTSWGYLDTGFNNYRDGFQSPPVNWSINTDVKRAFFNRTAELVAAGTATAPPTSTISPGQLATTGQAWTVDVSAVVVGAVLIALGLAVVRRRHRRD